jgi:hypothetical protein
MKFWKTVFLVSCCFYALLFALIASSHETPYAALQAALFDCRQKATYLKLECGTAVLQAADGTYRILPVSIGTANTIQFTIRLNGDKLIALFHTHPGKDPNADSFSDTDVRIAERLRVMSYIYVSRLQEMRVYRPTGRTLSTSANVSTSGSKS